jgi:hypothetical protein
VDPRISTRPRVVGVVYRRGGVVFGLILVGGIMECSSIMLQRLVRWLLLLDHLLSFFMFDVFGVFGVRLGMEVS